MADLSSYSVGIGLPVYNNDKYIDKVLDCLLDQTFTNIIIYISDDCSTDSTGEICRHYQEKDGRIRYSRNEVNIGANANNKRVLAMADTDYFMFSRGHEMMSVDLVEDCLRTLLANSGAILAFCKTQWIDEDDEVIEDKPIGYFNTLGFDVVTRCALALWGNWDCYYGLSKTGVLKSIRANEAVVGNDTLSLFEKALRGGFAHASSGVRYRRYIYCGESYKKRMVRYKKGTHKNLRTIDRLFPLARLPFMLVSAVFAADIKRTEKLLIFLVLLVNAPIRYFVSKGRGL